MTFWLFLNMKSTVAHIFFVLFFIAITPDVGFCKCSGAQNEQLESCFNKFFTSFNASNDREFDDEYIRIGTMWSGVKWSCSTFKVLQNCLEPDVIESCINLEEFGALFDCGECMLVNYNLLNFQCGKGHLAHKHAYNCLRSSIFPCEIDDSSCIAAKRETANCANGAKAECGEAGYFYIYNYYAIHYQPSLPACDFGEKLIKYVPEDNMEDKEPEDKISIDDVIMNNVIKGLREELEPRGIKVEDGGTIFLEDMVKKYDMVPLALEFLNSANSKDQHNSILYLKKIVQNGLTKIHRAAEEGVIERLIELLESSNIFIQGEAAEILGDIVENSVTLRHEIIKLGFIQHLVKLLDSDSHPSVLQKAVDSTAKLFGYNKYAPLSNELVSDLIPAFIKLLQHEDQKIMDQAFESLLLIISTKGYDFKSLFIKNNKLLSILALLDDPFKANSTLKFIYDIVQKSPKYVPYLLQFGLLKSIKNHLNIFEDDIKLRSLLVLKDVVNNAEDQNQAIIDSEILPSVITLFQSQNTLMKELAVTTIMKFVDNENVNHISSLLDMDIIDSLCSLMKNNAKHDRILRFSFVSIAAILIKAQNRAFEVAQTFDKCGGLNMLKNLKPRNEEVRDASFLLATQYNDVIFYWSNRKSSHDEL